MTEKPILFSTPMVKAILSGSKFQTRRVVKPQPEIQNRKSMLNSPYCTMDDGSLIFATAGSLGEHRNPPYQPGTILYVRETWYYEEHMHDLTAGEPDLPGGRYSHRYVYKAINPDYPVNVGVGEQGWKPSIHMPREAARLFLKVKNVRVERLQEITEEDAINEGSLIIPNLPDYQKAFDKAVKNGKKPPLGETPRQRFKRLWDSINAKRGYGWDISPWVWVVEFERIRP